MKPRAVQREEHLPQLLGEAAPGSGKEKEKEEKVKEDADED